MSTDQPIPNRQPSWLPTGWAATNCRSEPVVGGWSAVGVMGWDVMPQRCLSGRAGDHRGTRWIRRWGQHPDAAGGGSPAESVLARWSPTGELTDTGPVELGAE